MPNNSPVTNTAAGRNEAVNAPPNAPEPLNRWRGSRLPPNQLAAGSMRIIGSASVVCLFVHLFICGSVATPPLIQLQRRLVTFATLHLLRCQPGCYFMNETKFNRFVLQIIYGFIKDFLFRSQLKLNQCSYCPSIKIGCGFCWAAECWAACQQSGGVGFQSIVWRPRFALKIERKFWQVAGAPGFEFAEFRAEISVNMAAARYIVGLDGALQWTISCFTLHLPLKIASKNSPENMAWSPDSQLYLRQVSFNHLCKFQRY